MEGTQLTEFLAKLKASIITAKPSDPIEQAQKDVDAYNALEGTLNLQDGYNCPKCKNRGDFAKLEVVHGYPYTPHTYCECRKIRLSIARMERSGLKDAIKRLTFDKYEAKEPWQVKAKQAAQDYTKSPDDKWLLMCGQVGSGKTHLCTAVCREFLLAGAEVIYCLWRNEMASLKASMGDADEYTRKLGKLCNCDVLYLDDLFKPVKDGEITASDIKLTYDIINARYVQRLRTIISGEMMLNEMLELDEATASRIAEMSRGFQIQIERKEGRNYRLQ